MNCHLTYKQAVRRFGGLGRLKAACAAIAAKNKVHISVEHQFNEEEPEDTMQDWLNIIFEFSGSSVRETKGFHRSLNEVAKALEAKGMDIAYECNGDGDTGIVMSYRVI